MYGRSRVNVTVEPIAFTRVKFTCVRTEKLHDSGNPPLGGKIRGRLLAQPLRMRIPLVADEFHRKFQY